MTAGILELVAGALVFVEAHGVDPRAATQVWAAGLAGSRILEAKGEKMITRPAAAGARALEQHRVRLRHALQPRRRDVTPDRNTGPGHLGPMTGLASGNEPDAIRAQIAQVREQLPPTRPEPRRNDARANSSTWSCAAPG